MVFLVKSFWAYCVEAHYTFVADALDLVAKAQGEYAAAYVLYVRWSDARPKLRPSQDAYATALILWMIDAVERILMYTPSEERKHLCRETLVELYRLLDTPPPSNPFTETQKPGIIRALLFAYCRTRIGRECD